MTSGYTAFASLGKIKMPDNVPLLSKRYANAQLAEVIHTALQRKDGSDSPPA